MKIILAPDSFKDSMTAKEVCQAMETGIKKVKPNSEIISVPMADGGEGTTSALVDCLHGKYLTEVVSGPLNEPVEATYGLINNEKTAIIEMAAVSGITYLTDQQRNSDNIKLTNTYGTGQLINSALKNGAQKIIVGLGGSATNDGGAGMAQALGIQFFDKNNQLISKHLGGGDLDKIAHIDTSKINPNLNKVKFILASDVTNPLTGKDGASFTFGRQKGADQKTQELLDKNLSHYAQLIKKQINKDISNIPGSGAAGGLGAGLLAFTNAHLESGVKVVAKETNLEKQIEDADLVFTGEGATDFQTKFGKTPYGVAQIAQKYHVPVISLAGKLGEGIDQLYQYGFSAFFSILDGPCSLEEALKNGQKNVARICENIMRLYSD